ARQDQRQYRALVAEGIAEIQSQDVLDVERELNGHRLIEAEPLAQRLDVLGRRTSGFTGEHRCRVAGCQLQQQEIEHDYAQHDGYRLQQATKNVAPQPRAAHRPTACWSPGFIVLHVPACADSWHRPEATAVITTPERKAYSRHAVAKLV